MVIQNFKIKNIGIMEDQYLIDVLPVIPSNVILDKTITGCGATTAEIKASRHSLIVENHLPVIASKPNASEYKDNNLLGADQKVTSNDILCYLERTLQEGKYIKILVTPESLRKVLSAFKKVGIDIITQVFFLIDEIHEAIKDCDYRGGITLPMKLFFECQNKAMVSATPIITLSDPRFKDFEIIKIVPQYDYKIDLNLYTTNNVLQRTREVVSGQMDSGKPLFIFLNSVDMIYAMMSKLELLEQSAVFCSEKSVDKLHEKDFDNAYEEWGYDRMKQVNWLTFRFISAFDIKIDMKPNVLLITEVYEAPYTMLDPYTDTIQAVGRFRNGVASITHISNWNYHFLVRNRDFHYAVLARQMKDYYRNVQLFEKSVSKEEREALYDIICVHPFKRFVDPFGNVDYFKIDNYVDEELIHSHYNGWRELDKAYKGCGHFNIIHRTKKYNFNDFERLQLERHNVKYKEKMKIMVEILERIGKRQTEAAMEFKRELRDTDRTLVDAYDLLGKEGIEKLNYSRTKMKDVLIKVEHEMMATSPEVIESVYNNFYPNQSYPNKVIKERLLGIYKRMKVPMPPAVTAETIRLYFDVRDADRTNGRKFYLISRLYYYNDKNK